MFTGLELLHSSARIHYVADIASAKAKVLEDARLAKVATDERARLLTDVAAARLDAENLARQMAEEKRIAELRAAGDKAAADAAEKALAASIAADKMVSDHLAAKNAKAAKELEDARVAQVAAGKAAYIKANEASSNPKSSGGFNVIPVYWVIFLALSLFA
jgi:hypothetical protein